MKDQQRKHGKYHHQMRTLVVTFSMMQSADSPRRIATYEASSAGMALDLFRIDHPGVVVTDVEIWDYRPTDERRQGLPVDWEWELLWSQVVAERNETGRPYSFHLDTDIKPPQDTAPPGWDKV